MSILNFFDLKKGRTPRDAQAKSLLEVEENWDNYDIFCIRAPTAAGKSLIGDCIAAWQQEVGKRVHVIVPDNVLLKQAEEEMGPAAKVLWAQRFYKCTWKGPDDRPRQGNRGNCPHASCRKKFTNGCPYTRALNAWKKGRIRVSNYWMPVAQQMVDKCDVLIVDEAHGLSKYVAGLSARRMWHGDFNYPLQAQTYGELRQWCKTEYDKYAKKDDIPNRKEDPHGYQHWLNVKLLWEELSSDKQDYTVNLTEADYQGEKRPCIEMRPLEVRDSLGLAINRKVTTKIVLMSATLHVQDLVELGLARNRILFVDVASPIPPDRRPIVVKPLLSNRSVDGYKDAALLLEVISGLAEQHPSDKGFVHCTYDLARSLRRMKIPENLLTRLVFHDSLTKTATLQQWLESPPNEGKIFVGCGLTEGLDLKGDLCRWQCIAKIPFPSLADPVVERKLEANPDWYGWRGAAHVMQASGRVCRGAEDFGITYILDSAFSRIPERMWLDWFKEAIV